MRFASYWHETAPRFTGATPSPPAGSYDVAIVGGGFTGLSAARKLAREGASVVVLEASHVGAGASGRNGGHLNNGLAHSYLSARSELGPERAKALYRSLDDAVDTVERIVREEAIDCSFRRSGKLKLASKPGHFDAIARNFEAVHADVDPDTALLSAADLTGEIGSPHFHGAMLSRKSAMMHMGRFVTGLAEAAVRHGATVHEGQPVVARRKTGRLHELETGSGSVSADKVLMAGGAYTSGPFDHFRRRIVPVGSYIVATRPLSAEEMAATLPGDRTYVTSLNIGNYFRRSPDNRVIFGGRARFSARSDPRSDEKSGAILSRSLSQMFPHLAQVPIDYCWGGMVDMTTDRYPRAGEADGIHFAMGYSGHGAQMAVEMGEILAEAMLGRADRNPVAGLDWPAIPGHSGKPWFLPLVGLYYSVLDRIR